MPVPDSDESGSARRIRAIVNKKTGPDGAPCKYKVRWVGLDKGHDSWVKPAQVSPKVLADYEVRTQRAPAANVRTLGRDALLPGEALNMLPVLLSAGCTAAREGQVRTEIARAGRRWQRVPTVAG